MAWIWQTSLYLNEGEENKMWYNKPSHTPASEIYHDVMFSTSAVAKGAYGID